MMSIDLLDYVRKEYSQWGEDGILDKRFGLIGVERGYLVEFGAWDELPFSNTHALYRY
jgi:hypothetical protein